MRPRLSNFALALLALAVVLTACKKHFDSTLAQAQKAASDENFVEAVDAANMALREWTDADGDDKKAQAYQVLGGAYHHLRKVEKAIDAYQEAVRLSTTTFQSAYELGVMLLARSEPKLASKTFQAALRMKADDPLALVGLGNCFYAMQEYDQARLSYQRVMDTSPGVRESQDYLRLVDEKLRTAAPAGRRSGRRR